MTLTFLGWVRLGLATLMSLGQVRLIRLGNIDVWVRLGCVDICGLGNVDVLELD